MTDEDFDQLTNISVVYWEYYLAWQFKGVIILIINVYTNKDYLFL